MKDYLIILYSKAIDGTVYVRLKTNTTVGILDKAIDKLYESQYLDHKSKGYAGNFDTYIESCLNNDDLYHIITLQEPKQIINAEYFEI
jgi:hypothetical protein